MNKKQILRAAGAFVLIAAGAFAGRASKKAGTTALYYTINGVASCTAIQASGISSLLLTTIGSHQAKLSTNNGGKSYNLYATAACGATHKVYFPG